MRANSAQEQDAWALGVAFGCYQVHQAHMPYPDIMAFWLRKALKRIKARKLKVPRKVVRFCGKWCRGAEARMGKCQCSCHRRPRRQPRQKTQRWRSSR